MAGAYKVTQSGMDYLNRLLEGMGMPNPTGSEEFGTAASPSREDYLLLTIADKPGAIASARWLVDNGYYDSAMLRYLVGKGYLSRK